MESKSSDYLYNDYKIRQIFEAIKENGLSSFNDEELNKLLSILNFEELESFISESSKILKSEDFYRISHMLPIVKITLNSEINKCLNSSIYKNYIESINNDTYRDYLNSLSIDDLGVIKKYISLTTNREDEDLYLGNQKMIKIINAIIKDKSSNKQTSLTNSP